MAPESSLVRTLSALLAELNRQQVSYALAGGWAYSALVEPRATTDIDCLILLNHPTAETIRRLLSPVFPSMVIHPSPMTFKGISIWRIVGIREGEEVVVDLLLADSAFLLEALRRRQIVRFFEHSVPILSLEDLILLKTLAGRLQDLADLEKIEQRQPELQVDWTYVKAWKDRLGLSAR